MLLMLLLVMMVGGEGVVMAVLVLVVEGMRVGVRLMTRPGVAMVTVGVGAALPPPVAGLGRMLPSGAGWGASPVCRGVR